ncbi:MAG: hypothetical protein ACP5TL_00995 [Candidatus Micrarchaeia archaeon]
MGFANGNCGIFCVKFHNYGDRVIMHAFYDGNFLSNSDLIVELNRHSANFTTNSTGYIQFFAPLSIGANNFQIRYKNYVLNYRYYYFDGLLNLFLIAFGGIILIILIKIVDFKAISKDIRIYFDEDSNYHIIPKTETSNLKDTPKILVGGSEPNKGIVAKKLMADSLILGNYKVENANNANMFLKQNEVYTYSSLKNVIGIKNAKEFKIAALNELEYSNVTHLEVLNCKLGNLMLYMNSLDILEVIKCFT